MFFFRILKNEFYRKENFMENIKIIHEPNSLEPFVILEKLSGMPSAPLFEGDERNALFEAETLFPQIKNVKGKKKIECGLLHRIDTPTRGLLLIATSQEFYDHIILSQERGDFVKTYFAECACDKKNAEKLKGFPDLPEICDKVGEGACDKDYSQSQNHFVRAQSQSTKNQSQVISSYFRFYGEGRREVRPVLDGGSKFAIKKIGVKNLYSTQVEYSYCDKDSAQIKCEISKGFRHQVRCHLAWLGFPVVGDALYNYDFRSSGEKSEMRFFAIGLEFPDMLSRKKFKFEMIPYS